MKNLVLLSILMSVLMVDGFAQKTGKKSESPIENSKVTREYDEKGNLIRFDSVYTYSFSGDTTLLEPKDFEKFFGDHSGFFSDRKSDGSSFFDDFDQLFSMPFNLRSDSVMRQRLGQFHNFGNFGFNSDSDLIKLPGFEQFFDQLNPERNDSVQPGNKLVQPKSMEEMMKMMQQRMKEMEERQRKYFGY